MSASASATDVRQAFRHAAKAAHPDRDGGDAERFRRIVEAYRRLQDQPATPDFLFQPPTTTSAGGRGALRITPLQALSGGAAEHRTGDGRTLRIQLPPGLRTGDQLRAGSDVFDIAVMGEPELMVRGDDVWLTVKVEPRTLDEGGRLAIDTPVGRRIVWITRRAAERGLVRLAGQGLPARGAHGQGHLFVRLAPKPVEAQSAARNLLRRFAAAWAA